jgi:hypothetical protein
MKTLKIPVVGTIKGGLDEEPQVDFFSNAEAFRKMFCVPTYDPDEGLRNALALLPPELHQDQYYLPVALIFANVPVLKSIWPLYWDKPGKARIDTDGLNKRAFGLLSSGELFLAKLALHLYNDYSKLPKDGLLGLRNLDSYNLDLALHAFRLFTRGRR